MNTVIGRWCAARWRTARAARPGGELRLRIARHEATDPCHHRIDSCGLCVICGGYPTADSVEYYN